MYQKCPVCDGRGNVSAGFYHAYPVNMLTSTCPETCRTCGGSGVILESEVGTGDIVTKKVEELRKDVDQLRKEIDQHIKPA